MDENTQAKFDAKLKELLAAAKKKKNVLEYQEINDFFKDMPLEEEQFEKILETLEQNNVDVLQIIDDDDLLMMTCFLRRMKKLIWKISTSLFRMVLGLKTLLECI